MDNKIVKSAVYSNGRSHCVFEDGSAIILHPGCQFCSVFSATGEVTRQVTACVTGANKVRVMKAIELYNSLSLNPVGVLAQEIYDTQTCQTKPNWTYWLKAGWITVIESKKEKFTIQVDSESEEVGLIYRSKSGSLTIHSVDKQTSVTLNPFGLLFRVSYPFVLESKKVQHQKKLVYEYVTLEQIFSVGSYPPCWSVPVWYLWQAFLYEQPEVYCNPLLYEFPLTQSNEIAVEVPRTLEGEVWREDATSPSAQFFCYYGSPLTTVWEEEATYYHINSSTTHLIIHLDQSLLLVNKEFCFHLTHPRTAPHRFTVSTVPPSLRNGEESYSCTKLVETCLELQSLPVYEKTKQLPLEEELEDGVKVENEVEGVGLFTAYNDKSIRVLFEDRTCVRVYRDFSITGIDRKGNISKLSLDSPYGFENYIPVCVEFYDFVFTSESDKQKRAQEMEERQAAVNAELSRIQRYTEPHPEEFQYEGEFVDNQVLENFQSTQQQIEEINKLLSKINKP